MCFDSLDNVCRTEGYAIVCCVANTGGTYMLLLTQERKNKKLPAPIPLCRLQLVFVKKNPNVLGYSSQMLSPAWQLMLSAMLCESLTMQLLCNSSL